MLARSTLLQRTAITSLTAARQRSSRQLATSSAHKRALSKRQLEGKHDGSSGSADSARAPAAPMKDKSAAGGGSSTKPANVGTAPTSSSGAGGSILIPLILLGNAGFAGAYYNNMIPDEYLPQILKKDGDAAIDAMLKEEEVKVSKELKEAVEEVEKEAAAAAAAVAVVASVVEKSVEESAATTAPSPEPAKEEPSEVAIASIPKMVTALTSTKSTPSTKPSAKDAQSKMNNNHSNQTK